MNKKGVIDQLQPIIVGLVGVALVLVITFLIIAEVKTQATAIEGANGYGVNATSTIQGALDDIPGWLPIIIVALIGALLLGIVKYFRSQS